MITERDSGHRIGRCDRCLLTTPLIVAATDAEAAQAMTVGGWVVAESMTFCPRCRDLRLAATGAKRDATAPKAPEGLTGSDS